MLLKLSARHTLNALLGKQMSCHCSVPTVGPRAWIPRQQDAGGYISPVMIIADTSFLFPWKEGFETSSSSPELSVCAHAVALSFKVDQWSGGTQKTFGKDDWLTRV